MNIAIKIFFCTILAMIASLIFIGFAKFLELTGALQLILEFKLLGCIKALWTLLKDTVGMLGSLATAMTLGYLVLDNSIRRLLEANRSVFEKYVDSLSASNLALSNSVISRKGWALKCSNETVKSSPAYKLLPAYLKNLMVGEYFNNQREDIVSVLRNNFFPKININSFLNYQKDVPNDIKVPRDLVETFVPASPLFHSREMFILNVLDVCEAFALRLKSDVTVKGYSDGFFICSEEIEFWEHLKDLLMVEDQAYGLNKNEPLETAKYLIRKNYHHLAAIYFLIENKILRKAICVILEDK